MDNTLEHFSKEELIKVLVSSTPIAYVIMDKQFKIHYTNDYLLELKYLEKEKVIGEYCYNLSNNGVPCKMCAVRDAKIAKKMQRLLRVDIMQNGVKRYIDDFAVPLFIDENGDFEYILEIMINRTEEFNYIEQVNNDFSQLIDSLMTLLEEKDIYTAKHSKSVRKYSDLIAKQMMLDEEAMLDIGLAASLHDIGKVNIPYSIINKNGKLDDDEFDLIKKHSSFSYDILQNLKGFENVKNYVKYHHERYDGRGYPDGLLGDEIPLGARVICVADTYDAITSTRSYRKALTHEIALEELKKNSGKQFDPEVVEAFLKIDFENITDENIEKIQNNTNHVERQIVAKEANILDTCKTQDSLVLSQIMSDDKFILEIFKHVPVAYVFMDINKKVIFTSDYFLDYFGLTREEVVGNICFRASGFDKPCKYCPISQAINTGQRASSLLSHVVNGRKLHFDCHAVPYFDKEGNLTHVMEILLDRTEEMELRLEHENDLYDILEMMSNLLAMNDEYSYKKSKFIQKVCRFMADKLEILGQQKKDIEIASILCDIGMITLSEHKDEIEYIEKHHIDIAYKTLGNLKAFENAKEIIYQHHENFNGSGYPKGLSGEQINIGARMISVADEYFDKSINGTDFAFNSLKNNADNKFDPVIIDIFTENYMYFEKLID